MNVPVKSCNGVTLMPLESLFLPKRKIFLEGEITEKTSSEFFKEVMYLNEENKQQPVHVYINSPGGTITAGLAIYDVLCGSPAPIRTYCTGRAYSMAAILFAAGNDRYMLPNSELMLHEPLLESRIGGSSSSIKSISDSLIETMRKMNALLAKHTGKSEREIEEATTHDHYFSSQESLKFGLCDGIMTFAEMMEG